MQPPKPFTVDFQENEFEVAPVNGPSMNWEIRCRECESNLGRHDTRMPIVNSIESAYWEMNNHVEDYHSEWSDGPETAGRFHGGASRGDMEPPCHAGSVFTSPGQTRRHLARHLERTSVL